MCLKDVFFLPKIENREFINKSELKVALYNYYKQAQPQTQLYTSYISLYKSECIVALFELYQLLAQALAFKFIIAILLFYIQVSNRFIIALIAIIYLVSRFIKAISATSIVASTIQFSFNNCVFWYSVWYCPISMVCTRVRARGKVRASQLGFE